MLDNNVKTSFGITWDYRCPFARNIHEHVLAGLKAGAEWDVDFIPFSLSQVHIEPGEVPAWEDPDKAEELMAMEAALAAKKLFPDLFWDLHKALFSLRHDEGKNIRDEKIISQTLEVVGIDSKAVFDEVASKRPLKEFRQAHEKAVDDYDVFGVPTFIINGQAAFVRIMNRPSQDGSESIKTINKIIDLIANDSNINEIKHTTVPR